VRSVLNRAPDRGLPFSWTINPYRGCSFGCSYCYARHTHAFLQQRDPRSFERRIFVKLQAGEILRSDLRPGALLGRPVALGTATDPYQPAEARFRITRGILETLSNAPDLDLSITTKSPLVLQDLELLKKIHRRRPLRVNVSIVTLNPALSRLLEGRAPAPRRRLDTIRGLAEAGIPTAIFVMPVLPGINDHDDDLLRLLRRAREAGAEDAGTTLLRLDDVAAGVLLPIIRRHFPHLWNEYRELFVSAGAPECPSAERLRHLSRHLQERFDRLRAEAGFAAHVAERVYEPVAGEQFSLNLPPAATTRRTDAGSGNAANVAAAPADAARVAAACLGAGDVDVQAADARNPAIRDAAGAAPRPRGPCS